MGAMQNNPGSVNGKSKSRGSVKNADRLQAFAAGGSVGEADWGSASCDLVLAVVVGITAMGGAVTFGLSRDKGAHSITLMLDGKRQTLWFNGSADLDAGIQLVVDTLTQIG